MSTDYADQIATAILADHAIQPHWNRSGGQIAALLAEAARKGYELGMSES